MTQHAQLKRVRENIESAIVGFCSRRIGKTFRASDLAAWVIFIVPGTAPDSPSRVLRLLRADGVIEYEVVSRAGSLYRVVNVARSAA
jgi:hypothetical protein